MRHPIDLLEGYHHKAHRGGQAWHRSAGMVPPWGYRPVGLCQVGTTPTSPARKLKRGTRAPERHPAPVTTLYGAARKRHGDRRKRPTRTLGTRARGATCRAHRQPRGRTSVTTAGSLTFSLIQAGSAPSSSGQTRCMTRGRPLLVRVEPAGADLESALGAARPSLAVRRSVVDLPQHDPCSQDRAIPACTAPNPARRADRRCPLHGLGAGTHAATRSPWDRPGCR